MNENAAPDSITEGHYYRKQLGCKSSVIAWSHGARFKMGLKLIGSTPRKVLDYGCGDGTFLAMAADRVQEGWGADPAGDQIKDCQTRFGSLANLHFCGTSELIGPSHDGAYDIVTCMETLEHCITPTVEIVLQDLCRLVAPSGYVVISVPIEIGPTFLFKRVIRKVAGWRGLSDYKYYESYTLYDSLRMLFANKTTTFDRPVYMAGTEVIGHSHYGFNWRALRERVRSHLVIERTLFTPLGFLGGWFSSQVWFVCRKRTGS